MMLGLLAKMLGRGNKFVAGSCSTEEPVERAALVLESRVDHLDFLFSEDKVMAPHTWRDITNSIHANTLNTRKS